MKEKNFNSVDVLLQVPRHRMRDPMNRDEFLAKLGVLKFTPSNPDMLVKACPSQNNQFIDLQVLEQKLEKFKAKK